ncbi:MAG: dTDP-4-dehydrorhamnose reductase [Bacteroidota bacterium]
MKKLLIVGSGGQLGHLFIETARLRENLRVFAYPHSLLDISEEEEVREVFLEVQPDYCVNCAAYTAVDRAENEPKKAQLINATGAANLAKACAAIDCVFLHFSTDYVYADHYNRPLKETDETDPKSVYAQTKLAGEQEVLAANPKSVIIRTSWVYSEYGHNFVLSMRKLGQDREQLRVVYDQVGSPTYARDLAEASLDLLFLGTSAGLSASPLDRIYNYSNSGVTSWYDFCLAIHELAGIEGCRVLPILTKDYPLPAQRPSYSLLDKSKITEVLGRAPRPWREALKDCLARLD